MNAPQNGAQTALSRRLAADPGDLIGIDRPAGPAPQAERENPLRAFVKSRDDLRKLPAIAPLITDTIEQGTMILVTGDTGTYKTFTLIDWAASIALGRPWMGRSVPQSRNVLFFVGEGASGFSARLEAWEVAHNASLDGRFFAFTESRMSLGSRQDAEDVAALCRELDIGFVVFDTLNAWAPGVDENSASAIGLVLDNVRLIRDATPGNSIAIVHHTVRGIDRERGSVALPQGVDTRYIATGGKGDPVTLTRHKRKDGPCDDEVTLRFRLVPGTDSGVVGPRVAVIDSSGDFATAAKTHARQQIYAVFTESFAKLGGCTQSALADIMINEHKMKKSTFYAAMGDLTTPTENVQNLLHSATKGGGKWITLARHDG